MFEARGIQHRGDQRIDALTQEAAGKTKPGDCNWREAICIKHQLPELDSFWTPGTINPVRYINSNTLFHSSLDLKH